MARRSSSLFLLAALISGAVSAASFPIKDSGSFPINWEKYGTFTGVGTPKYKYKITDRHALVAAMGEGIYPNIAASLESDPAFREWSRKNKVSTDPWSHVSSGDLQSDFYAWVSAKDVGPGAKLLFTARALADAGHIQLALKAYNAAIVHFPGEACWSADHSFVWYIGPGALDQIESLTNRHPEIGYRLEGARIKISNGEDTDTSNDVVEVNPGKWVKYKPSGNVDLTKLKVTGQRGFGKVHAVQYSNGQWQLIKDGKPFVVHGLTYNPIPVGEHINSYGLRGLSEDSDNNGRPDAPFDSFVDTNGNGKQDDDEPSVGDFQLMKDMGANAIRIYRGGEGTAYDASFVDKKVLRELYNTYGISVIMGDFLGAYTVGSGASWDAGTDYTDPVQLENMRNSLRDYVVDHREEPYVLMWLIGNENLMPSDYTGVNATRTKASGQVEAYLKFVNEIAEMIHRLDPEHPVAVGNLGLMKLEEFPKYAPAVDIFGGNLYLGANGFGASWRRIKETFDRPFLITEFGCDAWDSRTHKENEKMQADYHQGNWEDIQRHLAGDAAEGNSIGAVVFEFQDEWWKSQSGSDSVHDTGNDSPMAFTDGWSSEEWYGMVGLGDGKDSVFLRRPREVYKLYRDKLWAKPAR